ncbi:unnamed protein product [Adineta ricciae]|uniref:Uncharacterized protein n=1 Tax=Adineta ricciae TaxID=249248 RepID=A0A816CUY9_ADIRI|nr:unnamed protein product [Adineta ricciae]
MLSIATTLSTVLVVNSTLSPAISSSSTSTVTGTRPVSVIVTDVDQDNKLDIVLGNCNSNTDSKIDLIVANYNMNNDNKLDVVVANALSNNVGILLSKGNSTFLPHTSYPAGAAAIVDFNNDSKPHIGTLQSAMLIVMV